MGVIVVPELNEIHFGSFDGGPLDTYRAWAAAQSPDERAPGGGESRADAAARFASGLRILLARDEDAILLVGHALMLRYTLDAAAGLVPAARMTPVAARASRTGSSARTSSERPSCSSPGASRRRFARERPLPPHHRCAARSLERRTSARRPRPTSALMTGLRLCGASLLAACALVAVGCGGGASSGIDPTAAPISFGSSRSASTSAEATSGQEGSVSLAFELWD